MTLRQTSPTFEIDGPGDTVHPDVSHATGSSSHAVQFYEDDKIFLDHLSEFAGAALGSGGACVVIATQAHREGLAARLKGCAIDLRMAQRHNRCILLDAQKTLAAFMVEGWPDPDRFRAAIEPVLSRAQAAAGGGRNPIAAFGEMVALLWAQGNCQAAIRLEQLWNELGRHHSFNLLCAYPMGCFRDDADAALFRKVCDEHHSIIPTEAYTSLETESERLRMVSVLQQKAQTLQAALDQREQESAQRKWAEEKLQQTEEFARLVMENSIDCVKVLDLQGRLEYMSMPGQRALEIEDIHPFLGRKWTSFWTDEDQPLADAAVAAAQAGGVGSFRGDSPTLGGTLKSWDVKITAARNAHGEVQQLIAVSRDITELKHAQSALMQAEKLAATGRMAATMAHEINNPLEAITNVIYLAKTNPDLPGDARKQLDLADRELARVAQIAQRTLGFYRDNSRQEWTSVSASFRDVIMLYEPKIQSKRLKVQVEADAELRLHLKPGELKQVLWNLVGNAIDASRDDGRLWLRARPSRHRTNGQQPGIRITLADNGGGMAPDVQRRIFVPFFTTKANVGTGIGLWVTKNLIENQGGYLRFRSRQGEKSGTAMSFFLPFTCEDALGSPHLN